MKEMRRGSSRITSVTELYTKQNFYFGNCLSFSNLANTSCLKKQTSTVVSSRVVGLVEKNQLGICRLPDLLKFKNESELTKTFEMTSDFPKHLSLVL